MERRREGGMKLIGKWIKRLLKDLHVQQQSGPEESFNRWKSLLVFKQSEYCVYFTWHICHDVGKSKMLDSDK